MHTLHAAVELLDSLDLPAGSWAATDADGTLWAADVAELAWDRLVERELMRPPAAAVLAAELTAAGGRPCGDVHDDARALFSRYARGLIDDIPLLRAMTFCYAGWTEAELRNFARSLVREALAPHVYATTRELLLGLLERGFQLAVVTGSPTLLVEEALATLELGAGSVVVRGTHLLAEGEVFSPTLGTPITWNSGKVEALAPLLGGARLGVAFGDTNGDFELLASAQISVLVHPRPALRAHAQRAPGTWIEFAPRATVSGRPVSPPTDDRVL